MSTRNIENDFVSHCSHDWDLNKLLSLHRTKMEKYCFIILNSPIVNVSMLLPLWKNASVRMVVDGGGNRLYDIFAKKKIEEMNNFLPHIVSGDFDSIRADVLQFYKEKGVEIISTPDQSKTDFHKALEILTGVTQDSTVFVLCDNDGRLDHIMANIHILFLALNESNLRHLKLFLLGNYGLTWLIRPGHNLVRIPQVIWSEKSICSLIPVGGPSNHVTTTGLKWNLNDDGLRFGDKVSTSNTYDMNSTKSQVSIQTEDNLLWYMTLTDKVIVTK